MPSRVFCTMSSQNLASARATCDKDTRVAVRRVADEGGKEHLDEGVVQGVAHGVGHVQGKPASP